MFRDFHLSCNSKVTMLQQRSNGKQRAIWYRSPQIISRHTLWIKFQAYKETYSSRKQRIIFTLRKVLQPDGPICISRISSQGQIPVDTNWTPFASAKLQKQIYSKYNGLLITLMYQKDHNVIIKSSFICLVPNRQ